MNNPRAYGYSGILRSDGVSMNLVEQGGLRFMQPFQCTCYVLVILLLVRNHQAEWWVTEQPMGSLQIMLN
jgi:hypothetical protein